VKEVVSCIYSFFNAHLPHGEIVVDYLARTAVEVA
jgi:hypothetical protein